MRQRGAIIQEIGFLPARYYPGKDCYVGYWIKHPDTGKWIRKKVRVNDIEQEERKKYAMRLVKAINEKLHAGWNPCFDETRKNIGKKLETALDELLNEKKRELEHTSFVSYRSAINRIVLFLKKNSLSVTCETFNSLHVQSLMKEIAAGVGNRTFNNYIITYRSFWNWFISYDYCKENPFLKIRPKKAGQKERDIIAKEWRPMIREALNNEPGFKIACLLLYHCLIRPKELCLLRALHFDIDHGIIFIPASIAKDDEREKVTIPKIVLDEIAGYVSGITDKTNFLFTGNRTIRPEIKSMKRARLTEHWQAMREKLKFPDNYHLYSLKDTGIVQMLEDGVPIDEVRKQARHSSLEVKSAYLNYVLTGALPNVRNKASRF
ncbi:MAG: site-specific integrase [Crocinitomicaceae bacterium]|nr:site-specific integrase [Crocinitomicaceae bacterium]